MTLIRLIFTFGLSPNLSEISTQNLNYGVGSLIDTPTNRHHHEQKNWKEKLVFHVKLPEMEVQAYLQYGTVCPDEPSMDGPKHSESSATLQFLLVDFQLVAFTFNHLMQAIMGLTILQTVKILSSRTPEPKDELIQSPMAMVILTTQE